MALLAHARTLNQPSRSKAGARPILQDGDKRPEFGTRFGLPRGRASPLGQGRHHDYYEPFAKTAGTRGKPICAGINGRSEV